MKELENQAWIDTVAKQVTLRASTPVYLTKDRVKRVLGSFNTLPDHEKNEWKTRAMRARQICKHLIASFCLPDIAEIIRARKDADSKGNKRRVKHLEEDLIEHGVTYENIKLILDAANEIFDATYDQYNTVPIADFEPHPLKEKGKVTSLSIFQSDYRSQERTSHKSLDDMKSRDGAKDDKEVSVGTRSYGEVLKDLDSGTPVEDIEVLVPTNGD